MSFLASKPVHIPPRPAPAARPSNNPPSFTERLAAVEARAAELEARAAELAEKVEDLAAKLAHVEGD